ncbi:MAG: sialate O-acetylesterase [Granulosicoccus sp.]|nr:sialate O-acetylesterase [Granulosicoccus sp.]
MNTDYNPFYKGFFQHRTTIAGLSARVTFLMLCVCLAVMGCDSDLEPKTQPDDTLPPAPINEPPSTPPANGEVLFTFQLGTNSISLTEGAGQIDVPISVSRSGAGESTLSLSVDNNGINGIPGLFAQFTDGTLSTDESQSTLQVSVAISRRPISQQTYELTVIAEDSSGQRQTEQLSVQVSPTNLPDVYLLIGQSNMVGISEPGSKQSQIGQLDAPNDRILQLNVTGNDAGNFQVADDFTNPAKLYNNSEPLTPAIDPLHDGYEGDSGKSGDRIGLGLTFAKSALRDTSASIYLVPAAWSGTGFCSQEDQDLIGLAWNAIPNSDPSQQGTLLYKRALARVNKTLELTNGVLRGILWHQGEADSTDPSCADSYADNLAELISELRTNIAIDARGPSARGENADIPFIAGTMSMGGNLSVFSETKRKVDTAHREIGVNTPYADFVTADDLVPPAFPCGGGSCIHFGASAYRELGRRYYEQLVLVVSQ